MVSPPELDDTQPTSPINIADIPQSSNTTGDTEPMMPHRYWRKPEKSDDLRGWAWFIGVGIIGMLVFAGVVVALIFALRQPAMLVEREVTILVEDTPIVFTTSAKTVGETLSEQGILIDENTTVSPSSAQSLTDGMIINIDRQRQISLTINGQTSFFYTVMDNPQEILDSAGITVERGDEVRVNGTLLQHDRIDEFPLPANDIEIKQATSITIELDDGENIALDTTSTTVGDALMDAGVELFLGDTVTPSVDTAITEDLTITIERSTPITIEVDGVTTETRVKGRTVADAFIETNTVLTGLDYSVPPENARLRPDMHVRIVRVTEEVISEEIVVEHETLYQADSEVELDQKRVLQAGENGIDSKRTVIRYENGVEVSRREEGLTRIKEPVDQIIGYGTKVVVRTLDTPEGPVEYWRKFRMYATSYHPAALGGDDVTATGARLTKGIVAVNPRIIPYNTNVYVPDYGKGLVADTGGPRTHPYWIDLGYDDDNYRGWHWWHDVYILTPVPENIRYLLPAHPNP